MDRLKDLYFSLTFRPLQEIIPLAGAGSGRRYWRLRGLGGSYVGCLGTDSRENRTFSYLSDTLLAGGAHVPRVYAMSPDSMAYLQQDLGDTSLFSLLGTRRGEKMLELTVAELPRLQLARVNPAQLYPVKKMGSTEVEEDIRYFQYCFLKAAGYEPSPRLMLRDIKRLAREASHMPASLLGLMLRDCQSRNVMVSRGRPYFIDFQSARMGCVLYDVASLLWQSRAGLSGEQRMHLFDIYASSLEKHAMEKGRAIPPRDELLSSLRTMVLLRTLQTLGAYGLRGLTQRKAHFLQSLSPAMNSVNEVLDFPVMEELPEIRRMLALTLVDSRFAPRPSAPGRLRVQVFSFSYKKGYPDNFTGDGGGFMFDCRAMHNPGRYDRFKPLTGRDTEVAKYLERQGEVQPFLASAAAMVVPAVRRYMERGFSNLQIGFGCTGGRHRSVYCAEKLARMLRSEFPDSETLDINLLHREQDINESI